MKKNHFPKNLLTALAALMLLLTSVNLSGETIYTVTRTDDPNPFVYYDNPNDPSIVGTLQWAIRSANDAGGPSTINFNIPGSGPHTIALNYSLPMLGPWYVTIDGTTQSGYSNGNPMVIIDGQEQGEGLCYSGPNGIKIKGLHITHFYDWNIVLISGADMQVLNNVITLAARYDVNSSAGGIRLIEASNCVIKGNYIGTNSTLDAGLGNSDFGMYIHQGSNNNIIGSTAPGEGNVIANHNWGILMADSYGNRISGNSIFNNTTGVYMGSGANNSKQPPIITTVTADGLVTGTSQPGDVIEIFGSAGNENANEYLTTVTADAGGNWTTTVSNPNYDYVVATATDAAGNTSGLSGAYAKQINAGSSCSSAIELVPATGSNYQNFQFSGNEIWFRLTASSTDNYIITQKPATATAATITRMELYNGGCAALVLKEEQDFSVNDSVGIECKNLTLNEIYYVRILKDNSCSTCKEFKILVLKTTRGCNPPLLCQPDCNVVTNGDFETYCWNADGISPFYQGHVCNWYAAWGSPQLGSGPGITNRYLRFWQSTNSNGYLGEGVYTPVVINNGESYSLSFNYKTETASSFNIFFILTNYNAFGGGISTSGGENCPTPQDLMPYQNLTMALQNISQQGWTSFTGVFTANNNFNKLLICSQGPSGQDWTSIDNITIIPTNLSAVTINSPSTICSGSGINLVATGGFANYQWDCSSSNTNNILVYPTVSTTYHVTATDINGCTSTAQVFISVNPRPTANAGQDVSICAGSCTTLTASGGPAYAWSTGATTASINVCPNSASTYYVTVTNSYGCTSIDNVTVSILQFTPSFNFNKFDNCEDVPVQFNNTTTGAMSYIWKFGDGSTSTLQNPTHTYTYPGWYNVTLTAVFGRDCQGSTSQQIYIIPKTANYNANCCFTSFNDYTYIDKALNESEPGYPNFSWTTDKYIKGTLTIESGSTLSIMGSANTNVNIMFGPQGKIIIKPGAQIDAYCVTFTSFDFPITNFNSNSGLIPTNQCGPLMWQGIEIWGNGENPNYLTPGSLTLTSSTISNAHNGVILGKTKLIPVGNGFQLNGYDPVVDGGYIIAENSTFRNNAVDICGLDATTGYLCTIKNCTFTCVGTLLDPYYSTATPGYYTGTGSLQNGCRNPFYPAANAARRTSAGVKMFGMNGMVINSSCTTPSYPQTSFTNMERGISAADSKFTVDHCNFTNHSIGIYMKNSSNPPNSGCTFTNNTFNATKNYGIYIENGINDEVKLNNFNASGGSQANNLYGIYLRNTYGFCIKDNEFTQNNTGIYCIASGAGGLSEIGYQTTGNFFTGCKYGIVTSGYNPYLQIRCNNFIPNYNVGYLKNWNIVSTNPAGTTLQPFPNQGFNYQYDYVAPAGNEFPNQTYNQLQSNKAFLYVRHQYPASVTPSGNSLITITHNSSTKFYGDAYGDPSCAYDYYSCLGCSLSAYTNNIDQLRNEYNLIYSNLDKGKTGQLLSAIAANTPAGNLKNLMVANSPLSDQVLLAIIDRFYPVAPGIFKEIMTPNMPVSDAVIPALDNKLNYLPPGIAGQLRIMQGANPAYRTLTAINREINELALERMRVLTKTIQDAFKTGNETQALQILENEHTDEANAMLTEYYLSKKETALASQKLGLLPVTYTEQQAYADVCDMLISLASDSLTIYDIDSVQEAMIRTIANSEGVYTAKSMAQAILMIVFGEDFPVTDDLTTGTFKSETVTNSFTQEQTDFIQTFNKNEKTLIYCNNPGEKGQVILFDALGRKVSTYPLAGGLNELEIDNSVLPTGVYLGVLVIDNAFVDSKKIVIIDNK